MKFKKLIVKNFRNFENLEVDLSNKNIIFGMNDSGKTNLLYAIRFLLDSRTRNQGFVESDYFQHRKEDPIEIILQIDIADRNNEENPNSVQSRQLIAGVKGARTNIDLDNFYIKLIAEFDESEQLGNPDLAWGSNLDNLFPIPQRGTRSELDKIFQVVYVDPNIQLDTIFKKNRNNIFNSGIKNMTEDEKNSDEQIENDIETNITDLNDNITKLNKVKHTQNELTEAYKKFRNEDLKIEVQSEVAITGYLDNLRPYVKWNNSDKNYYPTSGDGRKKLLSYAITHILSENQYSNKILVYLIEEPENSLHRSLQISLSKQLFNDELYSYFFLTTHSSELLYEMDDIQLIKIVSSDRSNGYSYYYQVPEDFSKLKKNLNKSLSQSIFYDTVLLVEGPSEYALFTAIMNEVYPSYEIDGKFILSVDGVNFLPYVELYRNLKISYFIKTDNDLQSIKGNKTDFFLSGISRSSKLLPRNEYDFKPTAFRRKLVNENESDEEKKRKLINYKKYLFTEAMKEDIGEKLFELFQYNNIYLSEIDLENDLAVSIDEKYKVKISVTNSGVVKDNVDDDKFVKWLQDHKLYNMNIYIENVLNEELANEIIQAERFKVLKEFKDAK
ncbi:ATP-dependent nuclease [Streptococcus ovis]|uniref:ATP-dependent nuclease n=1 Tax=Streptococcus ovis TaxID=82806 RepID=UPI000361716A|nr:AAA family ATPase [Streptococcus ovis]